VRWPWRCRFLRNSELVADASVELVMLSQGKVLRRAPTDLVDAMNRLRHGPEPLD
jgi:acyl-CoA thioester hydrolase